MFDSAIVILLFLLIFISIIGIYITQKREGVFSSYLVFILSYIIYIVLIPLELYAKNIDYFSVKGFSIPLSSEVIFILFQSCIIFIIAAFLFYFFSNSNSNTLVQKEYSFNMFGVLAITALFIVVYWDLIVLSFFSYENVAYVAYNSQFFSILKYIILMNISIISIYLYSKSSLKRYILILMLPFAIGVLSSDKNTILISVIGLGVIYFNSKVYSILRISSFFILLFPVVFLILVSVLMFSYYRSGYYFLESYSLAFDNFSTTKIDPAGPFISIALSFSDSDNLTLGKSYLDNIQQLIPKFIYEDRASGLAETFAKKHVPDWQDGQGYGYSPFAEGLVNFGYLTFLHFFVILSYWCFVWYIFKILFNRFFSLKIFNIFYKIYGFYFLIIFFRIDSLVVIKVLPLYLLFGLLFLFFFLKVNKYESTLVA